MRASTDELNVFIRVVESGSFSRAAEQLQMANSAVSRTIKKLESKLGVTLLARTTRQLALTQEGERYFRHVQALMQSLTAVEDELMESHHAPQGLLRIDAASPVILHLISPMVKPFRERYPGITLSLTSSENFINLIDRKVDIAIRAGNLTDSGLRARFLFNSFRKIVATPDYLAKFGIPLQSSDLRNHACLNFIDIPQLNRWPVLAHNGELLEVPQGIGANSGETIKKLCLEGNGIACLSDFMLDKEIASGTLVEVLAELRQPVEMPFNAVYYSESGVSLRVRVFIDFLNEWITRREKCGWCC